MNLSSGMKHVILIPTALGNAHRAHAQVMFGLPVPTPFHCHSEKVVNNPVELLRSPNP